MYRRGTVNGCYLYISAMKSVVIYGSLNGMVPRARNRTISPLVYFSRTYFHAQVKDSAYNLISTLLCTHPCFKSNACTLPPCFSTSGAEPGSIKQFVPLLDFATSSGAFLYTQIVKLEETGAE